MIVKPFCLLPFCPQFIYFPALIRCSASLSSIICLTFKTFLLFTPLTATHQFKAATLHLIREETQIDPKRMEDKMEKCSNVEF